MRFSSSFKLSGYLLLLSGVFALFTSDVVGPALLAFYVLALAGSWWWQASISRRWQVVVSLLLCAIFVIDVSVGTGVVESSVRLLMLISLIKLYTVAHSRDYLLIYLVAFGFLLIASTYTVSSLFLPALVSFVFFAILAVVLYESKTAYDQSPSSFFTMGGYLRLAAVLTILVVSISIPIFISIPRATLGLFRPIQGAGSQLSAFSDRVSLGDIGRIIGNRIVFMRIRVDWPAENVDPNLKWRGVALDRYDGNTWWNSFSGQRQAADQGAHGGYLVTNQRRSEESLLRQTVTLEQPQRVIFGARRIIQVAGVHSAERTRVVKDDNDSVAFSRLHHDTLRYTVDSDVSSRGEKLLAARRPGPVPEEIGGRYLQLPALDPRIRQLVREVSGSQPTAVTKALALENFLRTRFGYSLANESAQSRDPLAHFLFESRAGHCEYFSTALAIMLRIEGIPSRVVNGFRLGEFNQWSQNYVVRQSDAHSWVEAYFPEAGWVELDATPAIASPPSFYVFRLGTQVLDILDAFWSELVTFDRFKQFELFVNLNKHLRVGFSRLTDAFLKIGASTLQIRRLLDDWRQISLLGVLWLVGVGSLLALGIWGVVWGIKTLRRRHLNVPDERVPGFYRQLAGILSQAGFQRRPAETPLEFGQRADQELGCGCATTVTRHYYAARFGDRRLIDKQLFQIETSLDQLRRLGLRSR